jgi:hypothetical protein
MNREGAKDAKKCQLGFSLPERLPADGKPNVLL